MVKGPFVVLYKDVPSLAGKVIFITGGTAGLGRENVLSFAAREPAHLYFSGRSQSSADQVIKDVKAKFPNAAVTFIKADLASFASIQNAAKDFLSRESRLDILIANAGIMGVPPGLTEDGYEVHFGTNHMGHALLVQLLTPLLTTTAQQTHDARVIWLSSIVYQIHPRGGIQFSKLKTPMSDISPLTRSWIPYAHSKLANLLYARAYAKHNPNIISVPVHPGISNTNLIKGQSRLNRAFIHGSAFWLMTSPEETAWNQQWAATAPVGMGKGQVESGRYYVPVGKKGVLVRKARDDGMAERLFEWTQKEVAPWVGERGEEQGT